MNSCTSHARDGDKKSAGLRPNMIRLMFQRFSSHITAFKKQLFWAIACMLGVTATELIRPWPMKFIFDGVLIPSVGGQSVSGSTQFLADWTPTSLAALAALSILVIAVVNSLMTYGQTFLTAQVAQGVTASIRQRVYAHLQHLSRSFHDQRHTGDLMVRLTGDVQLVQNMLVTSALQIADRTLLILCMVLIMAWLDWQLTLIAVAVVPVLFAVIVFYLRQIKQAAKQQRKRESQIANEMTEKLGAITVIQAFARQSYEQEQFSQHTANSVNASLAATRLEALLGRAVQIIVAVGVGAVIWFGVFRVQSGMLSPGELLVFVAYMKGLYKPLRKLASTTSRTIKATVSGERLLAILDTQSDIRDKPGAIEANQFNGEIKFESVCFSYDDRSPVLINTAMHIRPGEKIALLGESGSGKSTIASLLLRLYDPKSGIVSIDGHDIRDYTLVSLRDHIALVLQEALLFRTSIAENIAYGRLDATQEDIETAARGANAHDFITQLPDGYQTLVGARGSSLSGGQRQRIAIARALIRQASIVILDEPVSSLDVDNRDLVERALANLTQDKTCLTITHDLTVAKKADRVFKLRNGQIQELSLTELGANNSPTQISSVTNFDSQRKV